MKYNIKTFYVFMAAIAIIGVLGIRLHSIYNPVRAPFCDISLANINALMDGEDDPEKDDTGSENETTDPEKENTITRPLLGCEDRSVVIYCQAKCNSCGTLFKAIGGYGPTVDVKGKCNKCGSTSFSY